MGGVLFRGGYLENRETKALFRAFISVLVVFVVGMFFLGMFVLGILLSYNLPYPSVDFATLLPILTFLGTLCSVSGAGLVVSLHRYRKKSRVDFLTYVFVVSYMAAVHTLSFPPPFLRNFQISAT